MLRRNEINSLLKTGFYLGLSKMCKKLEDYDGDLRENHTRMYYFPCLDGPSDILNSQHVTDSIIQLEVIWNYLPHIYKPYDPCLIFPSDSLGYSLEGLAASWKDHVNNGILLVVQTSNNEVFGAFFEQNLKEGE